MYGWISSLFCIVVVISNLISIKMVNLPFFQDFNIPAGILTYPITFFLSNFVTEIYGAKQAKGMVYQAFGASVLAYLLIKIALLLPSANLENQLHFEEILGLNGVLLFASLTAYIFSQTLDIRLYAFLKKRTGENYLWLRSNSSSLVAQAIDTTIVNVTYLHFGMGMEIALVWPIMLFSYLYKLMVSIALTPVFYLFVWALKKARKAPTRFERAL